MTIDELDAMGPEQFVAAIGWVFEHSPWVAERAASHGPFGTLGRLCDSLNRQVLEASLEEQLELLRAHPDLATRARVTRSSAREQSDAGLDRLTLAEYEAFRELNTAYKTKFNFPFLYAVKGSGKFAIIEAMRHRLASTPEVEFEEALKQVLRIARFRLEGIIE